MNVVFLSPAFPPTAPAFCAALAELGVTVLGIGDESLHPDSVEAQALTAYVFEPRMGDYEALRDAVARLTQRFGPIDRIESNGEHWLQAEARLRDEFEVPGLDSVTLARQRLGSAIHRGRYRHLRRALRSLWRDRVFDLPCLRHRHHAGRQGRLDGHYISLRQFPPGVEELGRRAVAAFDVRERTSFGTPS